MQTASPKEITQLLVAWGDGDEAALERLTPLVYEELHRLAHHYMGRERAGHTLQTTALVNEAYIRLIDWKNVHWQNRAHFFGVVGAAHASHPGGLRTRARLREARRRRAGRHTR